MLGTEGLYDDAIALLDKLGVSSCHWVGASVGGFVGMRIAARHPERIRSLTLIGLTTQRLSADDLRSIDMLGWALRVTRPLGPVGAAIHRRLTEKVMTNMFGKTFMSDSTRNADREKWRQRFGEQLIPEAIPMLLQVFGHPGNPPELLTRVRVPTLIIAGEDEWEGVDDADNDPLQAQRLFPDARLVTVPGAGHMVLVEQPEVGADAITEFIADVESR